MLIFEFKNGSIVNLMTMESLICDDNKYYMVCLSGSKYSLTKEEFDVIKETFRKQTENNK